MNDEQREANRAWVALYKERHGGTGEPKQQQAPEVESKIGQLLAELEQAERALDLERAQHSDDVDDLEARLARVPALVEALKRIEDQYEPNTATACNEIARTALAEWEQA